MSRLLLSLAVGALLVAVALAPSSTRTATALDCGPEGIQAPGQPDACIDRAPVFVEYEPERCRDARIGLAWYRAATWRWQHEREADELAGPGPRARGHSCAFVRAGAETWRARARAARKRTERWRREVRVPEKAIAHVWRHEGPAAIDDAVDVARCETGGTFSVWARNGQYENIFQMGSWERRTFGWHVAGDPALVAARAAHRYNRATGGTWGRWSCKPD